MWQQPRPTHPITCTTFPWQNFYPIPTHAENFTTLDRQTLTAEEKQNLILALNILKQAIENTLAAATEEKPSNKLA